MASDEGRYGTSCTARPACHLRASLSGVGRTIGARSLMMTGLFKQSARCGSSLEGATGSTVFRRLQLCLVQQGLEFCKLNLGRPSPLLGRPPGHDLRSDLWPQFFKPRTVPVRFQIPRSQPGTFGPKRHAESLVAKPCAGPATGVRLYLEVVPSAQPVSHQTPSRTLWTRLEQGVLPDAQACVQLHFPLLVADFAQRRYHLSERSLAVCAPPIACRLSGLPSHGPAPPTRPERHSLGGVRARGAGTCCLPARRSALRRNDTRGQFER